MLTCVLLRRGAVFLVGVEPGVMGAAEASRWSTWLWPWPWPWPPWPPWAPFCMKEGIAKVGGGGAVSTPTQKSRISS